MSAKYFYVPERNILGAGCITELGEVVKDLGFKKAFIATDGFLKESGIVKKATDQLDKIGVGYIVFDEVMPNPTTAIVNKGLLLLQKENCDFIITIGGGSPQDCGSAISILATNGGNIKDYEGINISKKKGMPIIAINTTAGTSAEITINYVITDEERQVKMVMVDKNSIASVSINDPELMVSMPASLTAATGMDALTHAVESIVTGGAFPVSDAMSLEAVKIIFDYLPRAVKDGNDIEAREQMVYSVFLAGMAFSNVGLGFVHAMAHQLGGMYDLPHGVCNAMLLPIVEEENAKKVPEKFVKIAEKLGFDVKNKTSEEAATFVLKEIEKLSQLVGIPKTLKELGIENPDIEKLSDNALLDICAPGNPFMPSKELTIEMYKRIM